MPNYTNKNYTMQLGLKCSEESAYSSIETAYKCQNMATADPKRMAGINTTHINGFY